MMYSFFGQNVQLKLRNSAYKNRLLTELLPYQTKQKTAKITISDNWNDFNFEVLANNPKQHFYYKNVFHIKEKLTEVAFVFNGQAEVTKIYFKLITAPNAFRKFTRKWLNMQFTNRVDNIGQIFHENVLIPLSFFFDDIAPIHASGFKWKNKTYLLGGTGGVGKTTLELLFCLQKKASFITDDIAIIYKNAQIFPNYNYPKIYGYNLVGNPVLKQKIFYKTSIFNKLHWFLHQKLFGIDKVRRKISPFLLYNNVAEQPEKLTDYLLLFKIKSDTIHIENNTVDNIVKATINVILTEYTYFFNHVFWHEFNALNSKNKPIISIDNLKKKWTKVLTEALQKSNNQIVNIPLQIDHNEYQKQMEKLL